MSTVLTPIKLQRYCATEGDTRTHLQKPFRADGWVYATNGHICVRVPDDGLVEANTLPEDQKITKSAPALFDKWLTDGAYADLPQIPAVQYCNDCSGKGFHWAYRCEGCTDGEFQPRGFTYDCKECEEEPVWSGWIARHGDRQVGDVAKDCYRCDGRGFEKARVELNGVAFELGYVHWLKRLPGVTVLTRNKEDPAACRFDGGEALLMPLRY
jgi:hypothetical protein